MKIHPVAAKLLRADGRTVGHDVADGRFPKFCERA
jgi:hypothetical protein